MTDNDVPYQQVNAQWIPVEPKSAAVSEVPVQQPVSRMRAVEDVPATTGIVLDQKVLIPLILLLGVIAGIVIMMIMDKYFPPTRSVRARAEREDPRVTLEYSE